MFFKNWPHWLKGGVIFVFLPPVVFFASLWLSRLIIGGEDFVLIVFYPFSAYFWSYEMNGNISYLIKGILGVWGSYFLLGAIIGLVYGKIKNIIKK